MTLKLDGPLVLAGAGKMGGAMLAGLLARGLDAKLVRVQDPSPPDEVASLLARYGIKAEANLGPMSVPPSVPSPPVRLVPPMTTAAMASSSYIIPAMG